MRATRRRCRTASRRCSASWPRWRPAEPKDFDRIEELEDTLAWETRIFRDRAQSLTYVCETPVLLEQRAFAIARLIAARL
jgi:hypothetical protein